MGVRDYLNSRRDDDRDRDDRGRGRDDDRDRRDDRGRDRDDRGGDRDDDRDRRDDRGRDRDDDRDRDRDGRGAQAGRFSGMRSSNANYPLIEDDEMILRIDNTFETDAGGPTWFHAHFDIVKVFRSPRGAQPGDKTAILHGTDPRSIKASGPRITQFVRGAAGFDNDEDFHTAIPKLSKSGRAKYSDLIDAALGVRKAEDEFGKNPLGGSYVEVVGRKGKYDDRKRVQYFEYTWIPVGKKDAELYDEEWEKIKAARGRDDRGSDGERGGGRRSERDDDARSSDRRGGRDSRDDRDDRRRDDDRDDDDDRGRDRDRDRGREESRRGRDQDEDDRGRGRDSDDRSRDDRDDDERGGRGRDNSRRGDREDDDRDRGRRDDRDDRRRR